MPKTDKELPEQTLQREIECWKMRVRGKTQVQIAEKLGVTQACVSQMLKRARTKYAKEFINDIKLVTAEQVDWHRTIYFESMKAWKKSKGLKLLKDVPPELANDVAKNTGQSVMAQEGKVEISLETTGNHNYLLTAMKAAEAIRKVVGLEGMVSINAKLKGKKDEGGGSEELATFTITIPNANSTGDT